MKIVCPISKVEETFDLIGNGADELFFGVIPEEWMKRYGRFTANRRSANNLGSLAEVAQVIDIVKGAGKHTSVALNGTTHTAEQVDFITDLSKELSDLGVDALIVGDVQVLSLVGKMNLPVRLHVSSTSSCRNMATVRFFKELGADRVILPRHISLREIDVMAKGVPEMEFEAFVLNDGCPYEEGLCHTLHLPNQMGGPLCFEQFGLETERRDGDPLTEEECSRIDHNDTCYDRWRWSNFSRGFTTTANGHPYGPCGLCAIPALKESGVQHIKIAGRDGNTTRKIRSLEMVREISGRVERGDKVEDLVFCARNLRGEPEFCENRDMCYYPESYADT